MNKHSSKLPFNKVLIASSNPGKLKEFSQLLEPFGVSCQPQQERQVPDAVEDGLSFVENAILKARNACTHTGLPALADDSGLEVPALNGEPGIYSARYAGRGSTDEDNNRKLLQSMADLKGADRRACFRCVLVLMQHAADPTPVICAGSWWGEISEQPVGAQGFGYDPLFYLPEQSCTSAQLDRALKNRISHRGQALAKLVQALEEGL